MISNDRHLKIDKYQRLWSVSLLHRIATNMSANLKQALFEEMSSQWEEFSSLWEIDSVEFNKIFDRAVAKTKTTNTKSLPEKVQLVTDYTSKSGSQNSVILMGNFKTQHVEFRENVLKRLGGRFNSQLSCGAGWVFPKKKMGSLVEKLEEHGIEFETVSEKEL